MPEVDCGQAIFKNLAVLSQLNQVVNPETIAVIWTITKDNVSLALSRIKLEADAEADIRNAVNSGKIATAHESILTFVSAIYSVVDTLANPSLYVSEKIRDIINIGSAIVMIGISQAVMANLTSSVANPILLGIFFAKIAITLSVLIMSLQAEKVSNVRRNSLVRIGRYV